MPNIEIVELSKKEFSRCGSIWNVSKDSKLAERFNRELQEGSRRIFVYTVDGVDVGEVSLMTRGMDSDYIIPGSRGYVSHLVVKKEFRGQGIGKQLINFVSFAAWLSGLNALSVGVNLDNYKALKLYAETGFDRILRVCSDEDGKYLKLLKVIADEFE
jgi:ribosomal protein S18 acetylase RimI-like enzyme